MKPFIRRLHRFCRHPATNLVVGMLFLYGGLSEVLESLREGGQEGVETHHAAVVYGLLIVLRAIPEFFEAIEHMDEAAEAEVA